MKEKIYAPGVSCILLESKPKYGNPLASDCVEQTLHNPLGEAPALVVVDVNHLVKIETRITSSVTVKLNGSCFPCLVQQFSVTTDLLCIFKVWLVD